MSRRNFMHQADIFFNANATVDRTNVVREPMPVVNEPDRTPSGTTVSGGYTPPIYKKPTTTSFKKPTNMYPVDADLGTVYTPPVYNTPTGSPIEPTRPEPIAPSIPIMPNIPTSSPVEPSRPEGFPLPEPTAPIIPIIPNPEKPTVVVNNNPTPTALDGSDVSGSGGMSLGGGGGSSSEGSEELPKKKSWIPLILTICGVAIIALKPFKK